MANFPDINALTLGNTFGAWYAKTNEIITRLNTLEVSNVVSGDGVTVRGFTSGSIPYGGYTLDIASTITKNVTFNGNVTINGVLSSGYGVDVSGINVVLPANSGVTVGNIVYLDSTGRIEKALANDECTSEVVGVVVGFTGGNAQVATTGKVSGSSVVANFLGTAGATLQKGVVYFLSGGVSGAGTTLEPDVTSYVSKPMLLGLTGDTGLILPYRGYIGLTAASSSSFTSATVNATGGVLSLNGITAALWPPTGPRTAARLLTTGHLHAVNYVQPEGFLGYPKLTKYVKVDLENLSNSVLITPYVGSSGVGAISKETSVKYIYDESGETFLQSIFNNNLDDGFIFTTDGTINDVYKITSIKVIPRITTQSTDPFTFSLQKEYNSVAGTTLTSVVPIAGSLAEQNNSTFTSIRVELRKKGYAVAGRLNSSYDAERTFISGNLSYSSETSTSEIIKPVINSYGNSIQNDTIKLYGLTGGTVDGIPSTSGSFPIVYPSQYSKCRPQAFTINNVTLSGADVSKYIQSSITNFPYSSMSNNGYTMESAILGWNAQYGAVVESLYFVPTSIISALPDSNNGMQCDIILELYKYNPTTQATTAGPLFVSTKYTITKHSFTYSGAAAQGGS
jgi:hypothetical protein